MVHISAPAKVNLYLHITGRRGDGYHLLDSLVAFTTYGDTLTLQTQNGFSFTTSGPFAGQFSPDDLSPAANSGNLVVRAAHKLATATGHPLDIGIHLTKNLPLGSGIGGGSSDAAACLMALGQLWGIASDALPTIARELGSDVAVCLNPSRAARMQGVGEIITPLATPLPLLHLLLVNPGIPCPTQAVYKAMKMETFTPTIEWPNFTTAHEIVDFLSHHTRNDMTDAAIGLVPHIGDVLSALQKTDGCLLTRMSGSGATCFAIYTTAAECEMAAFKITHTHPDWWVQPTTTIA